MNSRLAQLVAIVLAVLLACWPWSVGRLVFAKRGTMFTLLAVDHLQAALAGHADWKAAPLAWPLDAGIAQLDWVGGLAVLSWPLAMLGIDPLIQHSILTMFAFVSCGVACAEVARALLGPGPHTWVAGILAATNPSALYDACYGNLLHHETVVAGLLLFAWGLDSRRPGVAFAGGLLAGLAGQMGLYVGVHGVVALCVVALAAAIGRRGDPRAWLAGGFGAVLAGLTLLPVLIVYAEAKSKYGMEISARDLDLRSVTIDSVLAPMRGHPLHERFANPLHLAPDAVGLNPGYVAALLIVGGALRVRKAGGPRWAWGAVIGVALVSAAFSFGTQLQTHGGPTGIPGPMALLAMLPGGDALRSSFRWLLLTWLATAVIGAASAQWLLEKGRVGAAVCGVLVLGVIAEARPSEGLVALPSQGIELVYARIARIDAPGALYDVRASLGGDGTERIRAAFVHGRPRVGGTYARTSEVHQRLDELALRWPSPAADLLFRRAGVGIVAVQGTVDGAPPDARCEYAAKHTLCVLPLGPFLPARVSTVGSGPIVGFRVPGEPRLPVQQAPTPGDRPPDGPPQQLRPPEPPVTLRCGPATTTTPMVTWRVLGLVRHGLGGPTDIFFDTPCASGAEVDRPGAVPLYRVDAENWPTLFAHPPRHPEIPTAVSGRARPPKALGL